MKIISVLFKLLIAAVIIVLILQAEYRGRKLKTYVAEYFKSMVASSDKEMEEAPVKKEIKKEIKKAEPVKEEVKKDKPDVADIPDEDRAELQDFLEKEKGK